jgi:hypothetical protein
MTKFEELYAFNVSKFTEKKEGQTYLSWSYAWAEFKKLLPDATYEIVKNPNSGLPYFESYAGAMVYTKVTANGETHEMWLPIMDGKNKAMKNEPYTYKVRDWKTKQIVEKTVDAFTMFDVNKTLMRCLVKNMAMFGLALYIYNGEDLPSEIIEDDIPDLSKEADNWVTAIGNCDSIELLHDVYKNAVNTLKKDKESLDRIVKAKDAKKAELSK